MTHLYKLARRTARLRGLRALALVIAMAGCNGDPFSSSQDHSTSPGTTGFTGAPEVPSFAVGFRGGIPFGAFHQPVNTFGGRYNGGTNNIFPSELLPQLREIKERGGKVILVLPGASPRYTDGAGNFSLNMWKASLDRYRGVDFDSYIQDGTVVGNFLIDEPQDAANWNNGRPIPESVVEEMARYSKSIWPNLPTIARVAPGYFTGTYRYLDAAWAQYLSQFGDPAKYVTENVAKAKAKGLALVVGLNVIHGNNKSTMTASQIAAFGSALLSDSYPCAFISWEWEDGYFERSDIGQAMQSLAAKAANRPTKSCRGTTGQTSPTDPPPPPQLPSENPGGDVGLAAKTLRKNGQDYVRLTWSGARGQSVDIFQNGSFRKTVENDGVHTLIRPRLRADRFVYRLCERGGSVCSNNVTAIY